MKIIDVNHSSKRWKTLRQKEFKSKKIKGLSAENSKIAIGLLKDFERGINTTTRGKRTAGSLLRMRQAFISLAPFVKKKEIVELTRDDLSKICDKKNSHDFTRNLKVIFNWLHRTQIIKENVSDHLVSDDFSKGKPAWVYLPEEQLKKLINGGTSDYRALISFFLDSGIRPQEAWRIRILDFQDNFTSINIPIKRSNGERVSKTTERTIKLKICSDLIREYVARHNLKDEDLLLRITQAGFNKTLKHLSKKLFGTKPTKARESPDKITATDLRHNSACYWLNRYKDYKGLMYRMGWIKESKVFYYTEFLNMRDTIDDRDLITDEDKNRYEREIDELKRKVQYFDEIRLKIEDRFNKTLEMQKRIMLKQIEPKSPRKTKGV